jgi:hypothetical protein
MKSLHHVKSKQIKKTLTTFFRQNHIPNGFTQSIGPSTPILPYNLITPIMRTRKEVTWFVGKTIFEASPFYHCTPLMTLLPYVK